MTDLEFCTTKLGITTQRLAALLFVTVGGLKYRCEEELKRLRQVIIELEQEYPPMVLLDVLLEGRITTAYNASITLIDYVRLCPDDAGWRANVKIAAEDYQAQQLQRKAEAAVHNLNDTSDIIQEVKQQWEPQAAASRLNVLMPEVSVTYDPDNDIYEVLLYSPLHCLSVALETKDLNKVTTEHLRQMFADLVQRYRDGG